MSDVNIFSDSDVNILRAMVRDFKSRVQNTRNRPAIELPEGQSPDVYVAHANSGIPAMTFGAGTGTGTGALAVDSPGSAACAVYRRSSSGGLIPIGLNLTVYNYSASVVEFGAWIVVIREKFGDWVTQTEGSGSGGSVPVTPASTLLATVGNQSIPVGQTELTFDSGDFDPLHATHLPIPTDGLYLVLTNIAWNIDPLMGGYISLSVLRYDSTDTLLGDSAPMTLQVLGGVFEGLYEIPTSGATLLNAGDYLTVAAQWDGSASIDPEVIGTVTAILLPLAS